MAVPISGIKLSDVISEIGLSTGSSLLDCFSASNSGGFNSTYEGTKDSLLDFRGYTHVTDTISISGDSIRFLTSVNQSITVSVTSNTNWSVTKNYTVGSPLWLTVSGASGSGNDSSVFISVTSNTTGSKRTCEVLFTTTNGVTAKIRVVQGAV